MHDTMEAKIQKLLKNKIKKRRNNVIIIALSLVVAGTVFWQLHGAAETVSAEAHCGKEEHMHTEECIAEKRLVCGFDGDTDVFGDEELKSCSVEEHTHDESCYTIKNVLICGNTHEHTEECYRQEFELLCTEEHEHDSSCYSLVDVLSCGMEHEHNESCYAEEKVLNCAKTEHEHNENCQETSGQSAGVQHMHTDECYEIIYSCGYEEEHKHTLECCSDPNADIETAQYWEKIIPQTLTGNWGEDITAVAYSQLGYRESENNFVLAEDGVSLRGYTRFGAWYGEPYGEWNAMFVSFCLHYSGIGGDVIPYSSNCGIWASQLGQTGLLYWQSEYTPFPGDLVFFDRDSDGVADSVGIVTEIGEAMMTFAEGDIEGSVQRRECYISDPSILAWVSITEAEAQFAPAADEENGLEERELQLAIYEDRSYETLAEDAPLMTISGLMPEGVCAKAYPVDVSLTDREIFWAYDITLFTADGEIWEPVDGVLTVQIILPQAYMAEENKTVSIYYIPEEGEAERISTQLAEDTISFEAGHFSVYALAAENLVMDENSLKAAFESGTNKIQLGADFSVSGPINIAEREYALDLNGHELKVSGSLFQINSGSLTITDSSVADEAKPFTYSVTESVVVNAATGATIETNKSYTVNLSGRIKGGDGPIVSMTGGSFTLSGGAMYDGTGRAVDMSGGTANLAGGYIYGFIKGGNNDYGGAVKMTGGNLNVSGTVLAKNSAPNGGAIFADGGEISITDGVITENTATRNIANYNGGVHNGGGGIYCDGNAKVTMSGGYLTNNRVNAEFYFDGGGGAMLTGNSSFTLAGGYITGNEASGGGGLRTNFQTAASFTMTGGFVSGNLARTCEGGGVAIDQHGNGVVTGGYITNNITNTKVHWGGGGLFCADGGYLKVYHVIVTDNSAGGFGGGVAGCSTGRVYICVKDGGAIYNNTASGTNLSGNGSEKNDDHIYAAGSPVFMENGYQDYFCALNSLVEGAMLGGGSANWSGSMDGVAVSNVPVDAILEAAYVMGLSSHPTGDAIAAAQNMAQVYINGNSSYTHGGGILCNGYLLVGDKNPIAVGSRLTLSGTKRLIQNGANISLKDYKFSFNVTDENGNVVSVGTSDKDGNINFDRLLSFTEELCAQKINSSGGTADFVYYVSEQPSTEHPDITVDDAQYKITVTIKRYDETLPFADENGNPIVKSYYKIEAVNVQKSTDGGKTWANTAYTYKASGDEQHGGSLQISNGTTFTNEKGATRPLTVKKKWLGTENLPESITVDLLKDGVVIDTVTLTAEMGWTYTWENLAKNGEYTVYEHPIPGYKTEYIEGDFSDQPAGWYKVNTIEEGGVYLLVSKDGKALTGRPDEGGAYDFNTKSWSAVSVDNGYIAQDNISDAMQWDAVTLAGKNGLYLKNLPSDGKHYLSYQGKISTSSNNKTYASRVETDCGSGLRLHHYNEADNVKYVVKSGNGAPAASNTNTDALYLYKFSGSGGQDTVTIVNTKTEEKLYDLELTKVDADDSTKTLAGAVFVLLEGENRLKFRYENGVYICDGAGDVTELGTNENGVLSIAGLPEGNYTLREIQAPEGYFTAEDMQIEIPKDDADGDHIISVTVEDKAMTYTLPETGGSGLLPQIAAGLLLMAASLMLWYRLRRKCQG